MTDPVIGQRFGKLTITGAPVSRNGRYWPCSCDCGGSAMVNISDLNKRAARNGGCELCYRVTHGHGRSTNPTYSKYQAMKQRCANPKHKDWGNYGGRGITVCERWANSFEAFLEDMGESPEGMSIDRRNVDGNYEPGNCKWSTKLEQANNTRRNVAVEVAGVSYPSLAEACRARGIAYGKVRQRLHRGCTIEQAFYQLPNTLK